MIGIQVQTFPDFRSFSVTDDLFQMIRIGLPFLFRLRPFHLPVFLSIGQILARSRVNVISNWGVGVVIPPKLSFHLLIINPSFLSFVRFVIAVVPFILTYNASDIINNVDEMGLPDE